MAPKTLGLLLCFSGRFESIGAGGDAPSTGENRNQGRKGCGVLAKMTVDFGSVGKIRVDSAMEQVFGADYVSLYVRKSNKAKYDMRKELKRKKRNGHAHRRRRRPYYHHEHFGTRKV